MGYPSVHMHLWSSPSDLSGQGQWRSSLSIVFGQLDSCGEPFVDFHLGHGLLL